MKFELSKLPCAYSALKPYIDAKTMEIHHVKHHQAYVNNLNAALEKHLELGEKSLEELLKNSGLIPEDIHVAVRNYGGGHYNHSFFWKIMGPSAEVAKEPKGDLAEAINRSFGDLAKFREEFVKAAASVFGSGWAWLINDKSGKLSVITTPNQDSPLMKNQTPILVLDVWEHAYYLKYQNRRLEYIEAWWQVLDWGSAEENFKKFEG